MRLLIPHQRQRFRGVLRTLRMSLPFLDLRDGTRFQIPGARMRRIEGQRLADRTNRGLERTALHAAGGAVEGCLSQSLPLRLTLAFATAFLDFVLQREQVLPLCSQSERL